MFKVNDILEGQKGDQGGGPTIGQNLKKKVLHTAEKWGRPKN